MENENCWVKAVDLKVGMVLHGQNGELLTVSSVVLNELLQPETTYNLEIDGNHNYFVGDVRALAHNGDGSYTLTFASGKTYDGKGDPARAARSAARIAKETGDTLVKTDWTPGNGMADSFVQEEMRMRASGAPGGNTYNKISSPGNNIAAASGCP